MVEVILEDVSKYFGQVRAADDINLKVRESELFFLLGPSGCGKTTTLRLIAGFYKPDKGKIYFNGKVINDVPPNKRNVGMVFQNYALWPHMTVYDNIVYGLKIRGVSPNLRVKKAKEVLRVVEMEEYAARYPNQLSGGQQQRIALARALVIEPHVLLLDEPLSNLDAKLRLETREEIKRIQKDLKITTIYVTHDQSEALSMADRIAIMNEGRIEQVGGPREIYSSPANRFVAGFIGETNFFTGKVEEVQEAQGLLIVKTLTGEEVYAKLSKRELPLSEEMMCSVRPEDIKILGEATNGGGGRNIFEGKIQSLSYYGYIEHYLLSALGVELKATNTNPRDTRYKEGDNVFFTFDPGDVDLFPLK
jgi:iron(III) transport system ATP-binding protein